MTKRVAELIGLEERYVDKLNMSSCRSRNPEADRLIHRFYAALVLTDVLQEASPAALCTVGCVSMPTGCMSQACLSAPRQGAHVQDCGSDPEKHGGLVTSLLQVKAAGIVCAPLTGDAKAVPSRVLNLCMSDAQRKKKRGKMPVSG